MMGTCYTQSECLNIGGTVSGNCASGKYLILLSFPMNEEFSLIANLIQQVR
jgi:hypothetical protein